MRSWSVFTVSAKKPVARGATRETGGKIGAEDILAEYEGARVQAEMLEESLNLINHSLVELGIVRESLTTIKGMPGDNEVLVPMGGNSFTRAIIKDRERVIVGIGSNVAVGKSIAEALADLEKKSKELETLRGERAAGLQKFLRRLDELTPAVQTLLSKVQKEG